MTNREDSAGFRFTGRKFLITIVTFFTVVIGANVIMATFALSEFDGVVEEDAYRKGRDYNDQLAAANVMPRAPPERRSRRNRVRA